MGKPAQAARHWRRGSPAERTGSASTTCRRHATSRVSGLFDFLTRKHGVMMQVEIEWPTLRTKEAPAEVEQSELSRVWMPLVTIVALYSNRDDLRCRARLFAAGSAANPLVSVEEPPGRSCRLDITTPPWLLYDGCRNLSTPPSRSVLTSRLRAYEYSTVLVTRRVQLSTS
jgi:hypothetical protein